MTAWQWWTKTDAGLAARVGVGASVFILLALVDLRRHGRAATRWREYLFLLAAVAAALLYGAANDQITSRISWEYFYYGKALDKVLGPQTPPDPAALHLEAAKVGLKATWSAGLIIGVCLLLANNPSRALPRLPYRRLLAALPVVFAFAAVCGAIGSAAGMMGWLTWMSADFRDMMKTGVFRPRYFLCTYGIHLGGYVGGLAGTVGAVAWIRWRRRREAMDTNG